MGGEALPRSASSNPSGFLRHVAMVRRCASPWLAVVWLFAAVFASAFDAQRLLAAAQSYGPRAGAIAGSVVQLIAQGSRATDESRVRATNQFFNDAIEYVSDQEIWGVSDYWASPLEMIGKGAGDCEDYAMAKFFALTAMGMPASRLRMVFVKALEGNGARGQAHMVVAYYPAPGAEPLILDNLVPEVLPASRRTDLVPVYSFNTEGLWDGVAGPAAIGPQSRLSKWRAALERARAQGF